MDPDACLALIGDESADERDRLESCYDLRDWLRRGGFPPDWSACPAGHWFYVGTGERPSLPLPLG